GSCFLSHQEVCKQPWCICLMEKDSIAKGMSSLGCGTAEDMDISMMTKFCMGLASASQRTRKEEEGNTEERHENGVRAYSACHKSVYVSSWKKKRVVGKTQAPKSLIFMFQRFTEESIQRPMKKNMV
ncbi:RIKEN cDNA 8430417A20, partial [Mus musculus]